MNEKPDLKDISILLLDDDEQSLQSMEKGFSEAGARVYSFRNFNDSLTMLLHSAVNVIVAALNLVDEQCIEMIKDYKNRYADALFYVLADQEYDSVESSMESVRMVIDDYVRKPLDIARVTAMVHAAIGRRGAESTSLTVIDPLIAKMKPYFLLRSPLMKRNLAYLPQIAASEQTVLITGETGTGKELVARIIHVMSRRSAGPFMPINCGAIPESLIEGELFGHEKGAFTGAIRMRRGKFEAANNGTLFLDEIGDMPLHLQVRLLRVLEENRVFRIGAESPVPVNVRVIAASNVDLQKAVSDGLFREDLYYRLNVLRIYLPPLRKRVEDIPLLAVHFLERAFAELGRETPYPELSSETIYLLERYHWKGNVRELRNVMTRVATVLPQRTKRIFPFHILRHLDDALERIPSGAGQREQDGLFIPHGTTLRQADQLLIEETLRRVGGNRTRTAELLGVSLRNLRRKLNK